VNMLRDHDLGALAPASAGGAAKGGSLGRCMRRARLRVGSDVTKRRGRSLRGGRLVDRRWLLGVVEVLTHEGDVNEAEVGREVGLLSQTDGGSIGEDIVRFGM
jgi:hypothetical protein